MRRWSGPRGRHRTPPERNFTANVLSGTLNQTEARGPINRFREKKQNPARAVLPTAKCKKCATVGCPGFEPTISKPEAKPRNSSSRDPNTNGPKFPTGFPRPLVVFGILHFSLHKKVSKQQAPL